MPRRHLHTDKFRIFEVPDEVSYSDSDGSGGASRQEALLKVFRRMFDESQRRAIDCTGLRMLEVAADNLLAYGDVRGITYWWDTLPSIRILLEVEGITLFDGFLKKYSQDITLFTITGSGYDYNRYPGKSVNVLRDGNVADFLVNSNML